MPDETIFANALEKSDPADRAAYLDGACGTDAEQRGRIEGLLAAHAQAGDFLDSPAAGPFAPTADVAPAYTVRPSDAEVLALLQPPGRPDSLGRLAHYEILEVLGRGGFGVVFRAFDEVLQRVVAVKILAPQMAATSPARKRFLREARSSAAVRHENVVQVHAVEEQPLPYLVMEFIPGETLQQRLDRSGPLDVPEVLRIGRQIAEGLAAAHERGLIHRDVKPANVLIETGPQVRVKLTDFGLARTVDDASISQSGVVAGTPLYMAPEQVAGESLDHRADLFSLGSVLYAMCTGRPPFRATTTLAVLRRVAEDQPRPIREVIPEVPAWLCDLVSRLHAKRPEGRYQSAREVADALAGGAADPQPAPLRRRLRRVLVPLALLVLAAVGIYALPLLLVPRSATNPAGAQEPALAVAPFDAAQAKEYQERWARHLGVPVEFTNDLGMTFRPIPPGEFQMGPSQAEWKLLADEDAAYPDNRWYENYARTPLGQHTVLMTRPYWVATTEVTVAQFRLFVEGEKYTTTAEAHAKGGKGREAGVLTWKPGYSWMNLGDVPVKNNHAVTNMTWNDATAFCVWLSGGRDSYRLPTEAEWEFACRAGTTTIWSFGDDPAQGERYAVVGRNAATDEPDPVASQAANPFGLYDMHGGVSEWTQDAHGAYPAGRVTDPPATREGPLKVIRDGWWGAPLGWTRSSFRFRDHPDQRALSGGFRVAISFDAGKKEAQKSAESKATP